MCKISECICLLILVIAAVRDIQTKKISVLLLAVAALGSLCYQVSVGKTDWFMVLGGAAVGGVFLLISRLTREGLGYGDSIGIGVLGIFLGFLRVLTVISIAFLFLFCVSVPVLWRKKMSKKYTLPFYPFLAAGYVCLLWMEGMS